MKQKRFCICMVLWMTFFCTMMSISAAGADLTLPGGWSAEKAQQWYDRQPWLVGCNFTPSTAINQLEMWQAATFDPKTIDRELGWAAEMGMNTIRVYLHDLLWQQDSEGFMQRIEQFLEIADKHDIKTMLVLCDSVWDPHPKLGKQPTPTPHVHNSGWVQSPHIDILKDIQKQNSLEPYYKGVIGRFKDDDRVLLWDLYNEPGNIVPPLMELESRAVWVSIDPNGRRFHEQQEKAALYPPAEGHDCPPARGGQGAGFGVGRGVPGPAQPDPRLGGPSPGPVGEGV